MMTASSVSLPPFCGMPPGVRLGEVVAGKYALERILGVGGMGVVVGALHLQLDQRIAIKFMAPLLSGSEGGIERFMREARLAAHIRCEHVVRIFDVASLDDGTPYIVMEHLEGEDLGARLRRRGPFPIGDAVDAVLQASEAIAEAHVAGVVHRDLKPGNLFVCEHPDGSPLVKVLDFGISKVLRKAVTTNQPSVLTGSHVIMGSPQYCSPEQLRASTGVDARADIWALGAILYELVTGTPPFGGTTLLEICTSVLYGSPPALTTLRPELPRELDEVVQRSLAKSLDERFATIADLARALAPFAPHRALTSLERIESVIRKSAEGNEGERAPPVSGVAPKTPAEKTLPSRPDPFSGGLRKRGALTNVARWAVPVAVTAVATALSIAAGIVVTERRSIPGPDRASLTDPHAGATGAPVDGVVAARIAAAPDETASATPFAHPSASAAPTPLTEKAPAPADSPRRGPSRRPMDSPARPPPDTRQFGGLQ